MKPQGSWYFDGYKRVEEPKKNGKGTHQVLVYVGEYYGFQRGREVQKMLKIQTTLACLISIITYFYAQLNPAEGGMNRFVACPGILALLPLVFLVIGQFNFLTAKEKWEIRVYYAGYRRVSRWSIVLVVLLAIWVAAEAGFIVMNLSLLLAELHYLLAALVSLVAGIWLLVLVRKNPAVVVQGPKVE